MSSPSNSHRKITSRTKARRRALDIVFECDQRGWDSGEDLAEVLEERREISTAQSPLPPFSAKLTAFLAEHFEAVDHCLSHLSVKWPMRMMVSVDRCILRLGIAELWMHDGGLDAPIIIDQWTSLAAELSTDSSPDFVNGLLQAATDTVKTDFGPTPPAPESAAPESAAPGQSESADAPAPKPETDALEPETDAPVAAEVPGESDTPEAEQAEPAEVDEDRAAPSSTTNPDHRGGEPHAPLIDLTQL